MSQKKIIFYLLILPFITPLCQTPLLAEDLVMRLSLPETLSSSVENFFNSMRSLKPSGIGALALATGICSAYGIMVVYPSKKQSDRTARDGIIPGVGLMASAVILMYLYHQYQ